MKKKTKKKDQSQHNSDLENEQKSKSMFSDRIQYVTQQRIGVFDRRSSEFIQDSSESNITKNKRSYHIQKKLWKLLLIILNNTFFNVVPFLCFKNSVPNTKIVFGKNYY